MTSNKNIFSILLLGDSNVGKTALINRFINNKFNSEYIPTVTEQVTTISFDISSSSTDDDCENKIIFKIWDIGGHNTTLLTLIHFDLAIIVFDLSNKNSFINIKQWSNSVTANIPVIIIGTKYDNPDRDIDWHTIKKCIPNLTYFDTSAKNNYNCDKPFLAAAKKLTHNYNLRFISKL